MAAEDIDEGVRDDEVDTRCTLDSFHEVEQVKELIAQLENILGDLNAQEIALQKFKGKPNRLLCKVSYRHLSTQFEIRFCFYSLRDRNLSVFYCNTYINRCQLTG